MVGYCFKFKSTLALTDKEQVAIANSIRDVSPVCIGMRIEECQDVAVDKKPFANVLEEALDLIHGDRNNDYGHPLDDFSCTASMWTAYLKHRGLLKPGAELRAEDVPMMMINIKQSRYANFPKRDNVVDIAGYAGTADMCEQERFKREVLTETFAPVDDLAGD